ncbi:PAS domain-containing protein [Archangium minus]|uniref:histidine kinase n=1 Tax=Archangium minus TaxID=83450 RepID=A0ABY9WUC9_9BACT|nr:PAS domain-containing protein [Archangium violaceum]WNG47330.1 PAS domain-containing protein [Archangium minus]
MSQGSRAWLLRRLDAFLTEEQRRSPPDELSRYRLLVGGTLFLVAFNLALALSASLFQDISLPRFVHGLAMAALFGMVLVVLRRGSSIRPAAMMVCGLFVSGYVSATFSMPHPAIASHATVMLIPALAVYLMGPRLGLIITGVLCLNASVLLPLCLSGFGSLEPIFAQPRLWAAGVMDSLVLLLGWGVSSLFCAARDEAIATVRESERKLISLVESTDDPVCSLDPQGRIVTANSAARRMFREAFGREVKSGDALDEQATEERRAEWRAVLARAFGGQSVRYDVPFRVGERSINLDLSLHPIQGNKGQVIGVTLFGRDVSDRKAAEARLDELHRNLVDMSRRAGMAEVATGVLHNVGNTLNSVNVSATLVIERLRGSRVPLLVRAVELLRAHEAKLPAFLTEDDRGRKLPEYLSTVSQHLAGEVEALLAEMQGLARNVEHIKSVVSMQQEHARYGGRVEQVTVPELIDDALRLNATSFERLGIRVHRECEDVPPMEVDRHKLLQILVNLLGNARHALVESGRADKQLSLRVRREGEACLRIEVADNGVGIAPEHLPRLFVHGFTTKKDGHGFGLHASAQAAEEMGGRLGCASGGRGQGATFTLELPLRAREVQAASA